MAGSDHDLGYPPYLTGEEPRPPDVPLPPPRPPPPPPGLWRRLKEWLCGKFSISYLFGRS